MVPGVFYLARHTLLIVVDDVDVGVDLIGHADLSVSKMPEQISHAAKNQSRAPHH